MNDQDKCDIILEAAALLVQEGDVGALSFTDLSGAVDMPEADVRRLFPKLEDLVSAVAERMYQAFLNRVSDELDDDETPGAWTRAFIRASSSPEARKDFPKIGRVLLSTVAYRPELIDSIRAQQDEMLSAMRSDGLDPMRVYMIRAALEGVWMSAMFGVTLMPPDKADEFSDYLLSLTDPKDP
ncbi:MAG: hypothetical protein AAGF59_04025 [Pseudomonadota bacterium]